jgi:hypothetical protein
MKLNRFNGIIAVMLTTVMTSILITPTLAFAKYEGTDKKTASKKNSPNVRAAVLESIRAQDGRTEFSPEELEQMRSALIELLDSVQEFAALMPREARSKAGMKDFGEKLSEEQSDEVRTQIQNMSGQELTTLRKALNPTKMRTTIAASRATLNEYKNSISEGASETGNRGTLPAINSYCGAPVSTEAIIAADAVYFIAEGVRDVAQNVCNQVAVVAGFGANTRLACNITDGIYLAAKAVWQGIHFCDDDYNASVGEASFERLGHIHDDIEDVKANDNTNYTNIIGNATTNTTTITTAVTSAKTAIINNDNSNKDTIVNNDNANALALTTLVNSALTQIISNANANKDETKNLLLRTQIEADLSSTDGSTFVALYETPSTVCFPSLNSFGLPQAGVPASTVQCGLLDLVRSIVKQTIANVGAGTNAQSFFATAEAQRLADDYKAAYASYRKAYKAASK